MKPTSRYSSASSHPPAEGPPDQSRRGSTVLAHDYLLVMRGAERTFAALAACWPAAPIVSLLYDERGTEGRFAQRDVRTSVLQRLGVSQRNFRHLLPLYPAAARGLPTQGHDVVISSSSAFAHGVRRPPGSAHVAYCHSPFRYAWHDRDQALNEVPRAMRRGLGYVLDAMRKWDRHVAQDITRVVANSQLTRRRIQDCWGREASVVHPPVEVMRFELGVPEDYFLYVGEVSRHKRVELALEAARRARAVLRVVGEGPDLPRLRALYGDSAEFLGRVDDRRLEELYAGARALLVPTREEFGIAAVEAQAAGRPVVAAAGGGQAETVLEGRTGVFVPFADVDALAEAIRFTDFDAFSPSAIQENAARFSVARFQARIQDEVTAALEGPSTPEPAPLATRRFTRHREPALSLTGR